MAYNSAALEKYRELASLGKKYQCDSCPYCNGSRDPSVRYPKPPAFEFWKSTLKSPKTVVGPMVDQSELPFRMLCRHHGADLAYTPMFHSRSFSESAEYRKRHFTTCPADRPLIVQFCGHDADTVLRAAQYVENDCDAVDLNLGCPQGIARRGFYGSFLMEHWDVVHTIIHTLAVELKVPVTAKMRIFDDEALTLLYAAMLRDAGAMVICVHGRTRAMKGQDTGMADLDMIRRVQEHVGADVPVIANGNFLSFGDMDVNLKHTKCDAVMSAEGLLWDPRLFSNPADPVMPGRTYVCSKAARCAAVETALKYLHLAAEHPVDLAFVKAHLFKMLFHNISLHPELRDYLSDFNTHEKSLGDLVDYVQRLREVELETLDDGKPTRRRTADSAEHHREDDENVSRNKKKEAARDLIHDDNHEGEDDEPLGIDFG